MNKALLIYILSCIYSLLGLSLSYPSKALGEEDQKGANFIATKAAPPIEKQDSQVQEFDEEDFVLVTYDPSIKHDIPGQDVDKELKNLTTQSLASGVSYALSFLGPEPVSKAVLGYVGYKLGDQLLPPLVEHYMPRLPRQVHFIYRIGKWGCDKGTSVLSTVYDKGIPYVEKGMKVLTPPPPPDEIELEELKITPTEEPK